MGNSWLTALHSEFGQILTLIRTFLKDTDDVIKKAVPSLPECFVCSPRIVPHNPQFSCFWKNCVGQCKSTPLSRSSISLGNSAAILKGIFRIDCNFDLIILTLLADLVATPEVFLYMLDCLYSQIHRRKIMRADVNRISLLVRISLSAQMHYIHCLWNNKIDQFCCF